MNRSDQDTSTTDRSPTGRVIARLVATSIASLLVAAASALIAFIFDPTIWMHAFVASLTVWAACSAAMIWLAFTISASPDNVMKVWMGGMLVHFASVVGGGMAFILLLGYNPVATLLASFSACIVCVFGGAWMAQVCNTTAPESNQLTTRIDQPLAEANS